MAFRLPFSAPTMHCPGCGDPVKATSWSHGSGPSEWECGCGAEWETDRDGLLKAVGFARGGSRNAASYARGGVVPPSAQGPLQWQIDMIGSGGLFPPVVPTPPVEDEADLPVISGSVIGYRAWRIQDWSLIGTYATMQWVPGVNEARCVPGSMLSIPSTLPLPRAHHGPAPALGCHCGITALARFSKHDEHWRRAAVYGAIEAWSDETAEDPHGRFILHDTGFRAQFAKVVLLAVDDDWPAAKRAAVRALAQEHGADVCQRSHLEDAAKEHGQLVPDEMLRWAGADDTSAAVEFGSNLLGAAGARSSADTSTAIDGMLKSMAAMNALAAAAAKQADVRAQIAADRARLNRGVLAAPKRPPAKP